LEKLTSSLIPDCLITYFSTSLTMKTLDIALKDLRRSFRSAFALIFMFAIPLLVTGMFYLMFGGIGSSNGEFNLPKTKVVVANLDQTNTAISQGLAAVQQGLSGGSLGDLVVSILQSPDFAGLMEVTLAPDAASARQVVDSQKAGVAIIIPADFSAAFADPKATSTLELYQDPTLTIGPGIVKSVLNQFMDGFSAIKIAVDVSLSQAQASGKPADAGAAGAAGVAEAVIQQYMASLTQRGDPSVALLDLQAPAAKKESNNLMAQIIGPIMGGMMIFFAFFTGVSTAQSILREDEEGTLPRLFTTPTSHSAILGGKFLAVGLTVLVQVSALMLVARLVFNIQWGAFVAAGLSALGIVVCATSFGIFINSLLKSTRQGGVVFGGILTVTGMVGMMSIFTATIPNTAGLGVASLMVPQGWAVRGLMLAMNGAAVSQAALNLLVLLVLSVVFFAIGVLRFQKRYA
jgi:ABC-2 type transport system permease protein